MCQWAKVSQTGMNTCADKNVTLLLRIQSKKFKIWEQKYNNIST